MSVTWSLGITEAKRVTSPTGDSLFQARSCAFWVLQCHLPSRMKRQLFLLRKPEQKQSHYVSSVENSESKALNLGLAVKLLHCQWKALHSFLFLLKLPDPYKRVHRNTELALLVLSAQRTSLNQDGTGCHLAFSSRELGCLATVACCCWCWDGWGGQRAERCQTLLARHDSTVLIPYVPQGKFPADGYIKPLSAGVACQIQNVPSAKSLMRNAKTGKMGPIWKRRSTSRKIYYMGGSCCTHERAHPTWLQLDSFIHSRLRQLINLFWNGGINRGPYTRARTARVLLELSLGIIIEWWPCLINSLTQQCDGITVVCIVENLACPTL